MDGKRHDTDRSARAPARLVYLVSPERANALLDPLREHFAGEPEIDVIVERRAQEEHPALEPPARDHRRAPVAERDPVRALPPGLRREADHVRLVQRMEPVRRAHEQTATAEIVARSVAMDPEAVSELWWRVSERALARLRLRLGYEPDETTARDLLGRMLDELPGYDARREPLTAWLDAVVDRFAHDRAHIAPPGLPPTGRSWAPSSPRPPGWT
jgi:hypothetical protein